MIPHQRRFLKEKKSDTIVSNTNAVECQISTVYIHSYPLFRSSLFMALVSQFTNLPISIITYLFFTDSPYTVYVYICKAYGVFYLSMFK